MKIKFELFIVLKKSEKIISMGLYDSYENAIKKLNWLCDSGIVEKVKIHKSNFLEDKKWQIRRRWIDE